MDLGEWEGIEQSFWRENHVVHFDVWDWSHIDDVLRLSKVLSIET